jgi:hypothetical protein
MTGIELFENYFKQGDVFVWHRLINIVPIMCEITDIQPGCNNMCCRTSRRDSRLGYKHSHGTLCKLKENTHYIYKIIEDYLEGEWAR